MEFNKGQIINLEGGKSAKIISKLGEGWSRYCLFCQN